MKDNFRFDVFVSHSSKDKSAVRELADKLKADGLRVWFDEWEIRPGDLIGLKIEQGLEQSRTLVLFMSANAFASEWVTLERQTTMFRDPTNLRRRFVPVRLDDSRINDTLRQFAYVDWRTKSSKQYSQLLYACRSSETVAELTDLPDDSQPILLLIDDDLIHDSPFVQQLSAKCHNSAIVTLVSDPEVAVNLLTTRATIVGCITDIVFRRRSEFGGVRVAEAAIRNNVRVVVMTGHKREHLGLAMEEFKRIGLAEDMILTKPVTIKEHQEFFVRVQRLLFEQANGPLAC